MVSEVAESERGVAEMFEAGQIASVPLSANVGVVPDAHLVSRADGGGMAVAARPVNPVLETRSTHRLVARYRRSPSPAVTAAWIAFVLALAYAGVSVYWGLGGARLLGTVGGSLERAGREGGLGILLVLWSAATLKVFAAALPLLAVNRRRDARWQRTVRAFAWVECAILLSYGLVLTGVGLLIQLGIVHPTADADRRALAWHAFLWDPWFLVWGLFVLAALSLPRHRRLPRGYAPLHAPGRR